MTKQATLAAIVLAVGLVLGLIFVLVRGGGGDVQTVLDRQDSALAQLEEGLREVGVSLPGLQETTQETRDGLIQKQEVIAKAGNLLNPSERDTLFMAYQNAENDLSVSLSQLIVSVEIVNTLKEIQNLLQANQADLRTLLVSKTLNLKSTETMRDEVESRVRRSVDLRFMCDAFTSDLDKFLTLQKQQWLNIQAQMENLQLLAQGDPTMKDRFQIMTLLLELSGESINRVSTLHSFLESVSKKQTEIERIHKGLLLVVR